MPPELVPPALPAALVVVVALRCRTVPPPPPALGDAPALGDRPPPPTFVALAAGPGYTCKNANGCVHCINCHIILPLQNILLAIKEVSHLPFWSFI